MSQLKASSEGVTVCLMSRGQQLVSRAQPSTVRRLQQQQQPSSDPHCKGQPERRPGRTAADWAGRDMSPAPHTASYCSQPLALEILCIPSRYKVQK